jgi:hypothetical protein
MSLSGIRSAEPISDNWERVPTTQTMHDGTVLKTWGVKITATGQWIGKAHPVGPNIENQAEAAANAALFAASKLMAALLIEATQAWASQFDHPADHDCSISGADLMEWFAQWRMRARAALEHANIV